MDTVQIPSSLLFRGRPGDERLGETTRRSTVKKLTKADWQTVAILGAPDDLGVQLNRGRAGAKDGPKAIRESFYRFATPAVPGFSRLKLIDIGNIPVSKKILNNHALAHESAALVGSSGATLVALGGGHDYAAPHTLGFFEGVMKTSKLRKFGVINIDPHLDVRELENDLPHSGTAFRLIVESNLVNAHNLIQFGARVGRNAQKHFEFCKKIGVQIHDFQSLRLKESPVTKFQSCLVAISKRVDKIALSIDMDSCFEVEGASAAGVIGFSAWELCQMALIAGKNKKVGSLEIAELAPRLDPTNRSARIASEILFHFTLGLSQR
jgi:formiminoglutamase